MIEWIKGELMLQVIVKCYQFVIVNVLNQFCVQH